MAKESKDNPELVIDCRSVYLPPIEDWISDPNIPEGEYVGINWFPINIGKIIKVDHKKGKMAKESNIQRVILDWLSWNGFFHWRNYVGAVIHGMGSNTRFGKNPARGLPDIMGLMKDGSGRLFAIEVKTEKGKVAPHQKEKMAELNENGAVAFVARDLETVIERLSPMG